MRQFALALLEAADEEGEVGAMTRYLDACPEALNQEALSARRLPSCTSRR